MNQQELMYAAGCRALEEIPSSAEIVAFGAGRTVCQALQAFYDQRYNSRLEIVCGSRGTEELARKLGLPVLPPEELAGKSYLYIDGADQIDLRKNLIKGGFKGTGDPGIEGCMYREKQLAYSAERFVVIADESKAVPFLGFNSYRLPIEFEPQKAEEVIRKLRKMTGELRRLPSYEYEGLRLDARVRQKPDGKPFVTENNGNILDVIIDALAVPVSSNYEELEENLRSIDGVISTGLFAVRRPDKVIIAATDGIRIL